MAAPTEVAGRTSSNRAGRPRQATEIEQKYELPEGFAVPDLTGLPGVATVDDPVRHRLDATYFDTRDLRLLAARRTLRRRTGGTDAGWHLKEPADAPGARTEVTLPPGRSVRTVPAALRDAVAVHTRGRDLEPVARLATTRTVHLLRDADGAPLAEVSLDEVEATAHGVDGGRSVSTWRELEVELVDGDRALLQAVAERVVEAGAEPSAHASKLARGLGRSSGGPSPTPGADRPHLGLAAATLRDYLTAEVAHLEANDPLVRADAPDAVHQMRVACRRLRSALASFRPLLDRSVTDPIRTELKWIAAELGAARDVEVIRDHLVEAVAQEPAALRRGPVVGRIRRTMDARYRQAHRHGAAQMDTPRYYALLDSLDDLVRELPLSPGASRRGRKKLARVAHRTWRRVDRVHDRLVEAEGSGASAAEVDAILHDLRKAAKRARYAGEALVPVFGEAAEHYARVMEGIQSVLGEHQDSVVIRAELLDLADAAAAAGESSFTYGRLHARAEALGERTRHLFDEVWTGAAPLAAD